MNTVLFHWELLQACIEVTEAEHRIEICGERFVMSEMHFRDITTYCNVPA